MRNHLLPPAALHASNLNVLRYLAYGATVLVVAATLLALTRPAAAECNCSGKDSAAGMRASRDAGPNGAPELSPEERARWNTVGAYQWSRGGWAETLFHMFGGPDPYNTWGAFDADAMLHNDTYRTGREAPGMGHWSW